MSFIESPPSLLENSTLFGNCFWGGLPGESGLKEEVEKLMHKKALVIEEFMQKVNDAAVSDICKAELLGEYQESIPVW